MTGPKPKGPLISVTDLAALLAEGGVPVVMDVRWRLGGPPGIEAYEAGHLPGAAFVNLDADLAGPPGTGGGGRHPLPERSVFEAAMRAAGLDDGQLAVVYDDAGSTIAARLWWLLRYFGHEHVAVLDGGLTAWTAAGHPVTARTPGPASGTFTAGPGGGMPVLDAEAAARLARSGFLLDARASERYRGDVEPIDRAAGHIPGAISAPATGNVGSDGVFLRAAELVERFRGLGLPGPPAATGQERPRPAAGPQGPRPAAGPQGPSSARTAGPGSPRRRRSWRWSWPACRPPSMSARGRRGPPTPLAR